MAAVSQVIERHQRYANVDLTDVRVWRAKTPADWRTVADLRKSGFGRIRKDQKTAWVSDAELRGQGLCLLGAIDHQSPIGTLRLDDGRQGQLELERFVDLDFLISDQERPFVQFSRLSMLKDAQGSDVMFGLFKSAWKWSLVEGLESIVISTPPWAKAIYEFMAFHDYGGAGEFNHPLLPGVVHYIMKLPVQGAEQIWRAFCKPLCTQFFDTEHANLEFWR